MEPGTENDAELVSESLAGNREAFGDLYDRYAATVRVIVAGVSGDWGAVEDMAQESFLRAYRNLSRLRDRQRFGAWIAGIARQVARERRRTLRRDRHKFRDPQPWEVESTHHHRQEIHDDDDLRRIMELLADLEENERLAIHTFFLQGNSALESAEVVGLSRSGFYALLQRAIARLAASFEPCGSSGKRKK
jgi:RNA polymerase sigma-70 factor (ECF subfamily)